MGERFRLKASFNISTYPADVQVILRAMKKYGIIMADNGSAWFISGKPDPRWNNTNLQTFSQLLGSNFEAVDATVLEIDPNSGAAIQQRRSRHRQSFVGDRADRALPDIHGDADRRFWRRHVERQRHSWWRHCCRNHRQQRSVSAADGRSVTADGDGPGDEPGLAHIERHGHGHHHSAREHHVGQSVTGHDRKLHVDGQRRGIRRGLRRVLRRRSAGDELCLVNQVDRHRQCAGGEGRRFRSASRLRRRRLEHRIRERRRASAAVTIAISPTTATVRVRQSRQFTATIQGTTNTSATWKVNGIVGGNGTVGTVSQSGRVQGAELGSVSRDRDGQRDIGRRSNEDGNRVGHDFQEVNRSVHSTECFASARQKGALAIVARKSDRGVVCRRRVVGAIEAPEQVRANGVEQIVVIQLQPIEN